MSPVVITALGVLAMVAVLVAWAWDRHDHRRYLAGADPGPGPEDTRARGEAWRPMVGDGPPRLAVWTGRTTARCAGAASEVSLPRRAASAGP